MAIMPLKLTANPKIMRLGPYIQGVDPIQGVVPGASSPWPGGRISALNALGPNNEVWMFGGRTFDGKILDELWSYNVGENKWTNHARSSDSQEWPPMMAGGCMVVNPKSKDVFVFNAGASFDEDGEKESNLGLGE